MQAFKVKHEDDEDMNDNYRNNKMELPELKIRYMK